MNDDEIEATALAAVLLLRADDQQGAALLLNGVDAADVDPIDRIIRLFIPGQPASGASDAAVRTLMLRHLEAAS